MKKRKSRNCNLNAIYNLLKTNAGILIEKGVPLAGFYIRETENKVFVELRSIDTYSVNIINEVIGEYPFIEFVEVDPFIEQ